MKRSPLRKVSRKQTQELNRRRKLKAELLAEIPDGKCPVCGKFPDFRGLQLVHRKALSRGGLTERPNCYIACGRCHFTVEHGIREKDSQPKWSGGR